MGSSRTTRARSASRARSARGPPSPSGSRSPLRRPRPPRQPLPPGRGACGSSICAEGAMDRLNLLVIDDDPNIRNLLTDLLRGRPDLNLLIAGSGPEAVQHFATSRIDLVLTDIHMPGFTGLELMADMRKINFKPEILVMTANATPENVETARRLGARSVILKPFDDLEVIEAEINKALRSVKTARARINGDGNGHGLPQP